MGIRILAFVILAAFLISCGDSSSSTTSPGCPEYVDVPMEASDVYGTGRYSQYRSEFEERTGCVSMVGCDKMATIKVPLDDYKGVKWCIYW